MPVCGATLRASRRPPRWWRARSFGTWARSAATCALDTRCTYYNQTYWREALGFCLKKDGTTCHVVTAGKRCVAAHSSDVAPMLIARCPRRSRTGAAAKSRWRTSWNDGARNNVLEPGDLVTGMTVPGAGRSLGAGYQKLRPRAAIDFPMRSVAFAARFDGATCHDPRLVVSALAARPRTITGLDAVAGGRTLDGDVLEAVAQAASKQCQPQTSIPYDKDWRHAMVPVFVKRAMREAAGA